MHYTCDTCKQTKNENDFYADKHKTSGRMSDCKDCAKEKARLRYIAKMQKSGKAYTPLNERRASQNATCTHCGNTFIKTAAESKFCSRRCANTFNTSNRPKQTSSKTYKGKQLTLLCCQICNSLFGSAQPMAKTCSEECRATLVARRYKAKCEKRRAQKFKVHYEPVNRNDIFERDNWRCGLCYEEIDQSLAWPHPKSKSIDHIVPVSKGGAHEPGNLQAAHLGCNSSKGDQEDWTYPTGVFPEGVTG